MKIGTSNFFRCVVILSLLVISSSASRVLATPGDLDLNFNPGPLTQGGAIENGLNLYAVAVQPDGKIIVGGEFDQVNYVDRDLIARFNPDGSLDLSFNTPLEKIDTFDGFPNDIAIQPDGKILVCGYFNVAGQLKFLVRLNSDGSLDSTFNANLGGTTNNVYRIVLQPDGKIIIGSNSLNLVDGVPVNFLARLNSDGSLDTPLGAVASLSLGVFAIALQPDGKIVVGGSRTLVRLNSDGTSDPGFSAPSMDVNAVYSLALQQDGKILYGGQASLAGGGAILGRLNTNGSVDGTFTPTISSGGVLSIVTQSDGKILAGGEFRYVNGVLRPHLVRLNPDGSLDSFPIATPGAFLEEVAVEANGNILIVGGFQNIVQPDNSSIGRTGVARLLDPKYRLSSSPDGTAPIVVDDDLDVYLNDVLIYTDGTALAGSRPPILFTAMPGDSVRLVVRDTYFDCQSLTPVYLTDAAGNGVLVDPGFNGGCGHVPGEPLVVHDYTFIIGAIPNTNPGNNVNVESPSGDADVTFSQITAAGVTTFTAIDPNTAGTLPSGYTVCPTCPAYNITTTATYVPPVTVCLMVPANIDDPTFQAMALLHGENGALVDITTNHITNGDGTREVCGEVTSLSPFVLAQTPEPTPTPTPEPTPTPTPEPTPTPTLPNPPTNLMATGISMTQIRLVWTDNSNNEDGFVIERCDKKNCRSIIQIGQPGADVTDFIDSELSAATQYTYRMRAYNAAGSSAYSNKSTGKTLRR